MENIFGVQGEREREAENDAALIDKVKQQQGGCYESERNGKYRRRVACWTSLTDLHSSLFVLPQHGNSSCFSSSRWQHTEAKSCMTIGASPTHSTKAFTCVLWWLCAEENAVLAHLGENMAKRFSLTMCKKVKNCFVFLLSNDGKYFSDTWFSLSIQFHASVAFQRNPCGDFYISFHGNLKWSWNLCGIFLNFELF